MGILHLELCGSPRGGAALAVRVGGRPRDAGIGGSGTGGDDHAEWLIFGAGLSELGVHPTSGVHEGAQYSAPRQHSIALMCDDLDATVAELRQRGAELAGQPDGSMGFGRGVLVRVPGADDMLLYQPHHLTAYDLR